MLRHWNHSIRHLIIEEDGPTAVEYAVMLGALVGVMMASIATVGGGLRAAFEFIAAALQIT